jgi:hypothetical protein
MKFTPFQNFKDKYLSRSHGRLSGFILSAYGKLPIYKDYILWECNVGGAAEFKRWLDESFGLAWEEFEGKGTTLRGPARAMLLLPGGRHAVALAIRPSTDEGGLRKFPFCVFAVYPRGEIVGRGVRGAIESLLPVWRSLEMQCQAMHECTTIEGLYSFLQRETPMMEEDAAPTEGEPDLAAWLAALDTTHGAGCRAASEQAVRSTIAAYRTFPEQGESLAVRLPLASSLDVAPQTELWAEAFQSNLKKIPTFPSFILEMEEDGAPPRAVELIWRDLKREDARLFGQQIESYEFIENILPAAPIENADTAASSPPPADTAAWLASLGQG